jgi:peptidoglycan/xylan/chitin deacetylase (PgdA/CDA1 family)
MLKSNILKLCAFVALFSIIVPINSVYSEESEKLQIEIKYTNGDRIDTWQAKYVVYQDNEKTPILEKELENNPDTVVLPRDHHYKVEVFVNGMFSEMGSIELRDEPEKLDMYIPLSGGLKFNVFFEDGETPVENAIVVIKSPDGEEQRIGTTNEQGATMRYWLQPTILEDNYYTAEVFYDDFLLTSISKVKIYQDVYQDQKILVPIPSVVEELITFRLYDAESQRILKSDGDFSILLVDRNDSPLEKFMMNSEGDIYFSSLPSGVYSVSVLRDGIKDILWEDTEIAITGNQNEFDLLQMDKIALSYWIYENTIHEPVSEPVSEPDYEPFFEPIIYEPTVDEYILSCNCVSFRFDDVQDYWLNDIQSEIISVFSKNNIPLTVGIIPNEFGNDSKIVDVVKNEIKNNKIEIAIHGFVHVPFTQFDKQEQNEMITKSNNKIYEILNVNSTIFIPPENKFNDDTVQVLIENGFTHMSASTNTDTPPFLLEDESFYRFPEVATTGGYIPSQNRILGVSSDQTFSDALDGINKYGFAVITMHPQEFSVYEGGEYLNEINLEQIKELENLIEKIKSENIETVYLGQIERNMFKVRITAEQDDSSEEYVVPKWIKNNAGWWRDGHIDDNSFVQSIQFLIKEGIMQIPPTTQGSGGSDIPDWVKNNAGWWAEDRISDNDFISGVNYLVNQGIIIIEI